MGERVALTLLAFARNWGEMNPWVRGATGSGRGLAAEDGERLPRAGLAVGEDRAVGDKRCKKKKFSRSLGGQSIKWHVVTLRIQIPGRKHLTQKTSG